MALFRIRAAHITALSSTILRILAYVFFRWIPGHQLPPIIYAVYLIYLTSYFFTPILSLQQRLQTGKGYRQPKDGHTETEIPSRKELSVDRLEQTELEFVSGGPETDTPVHHPDTDATLKLSSPYNAFDAVLNIHKTILLGLPNAKSMLWGLTTLIINLVLVLGVLDVVYRAPMLYQSHDLSFSRVGFVSDTSAKILVREPKVSQLPIHVSYREISSNTNDEWKSAGAVHWLSNDTDYASSVIISNLHPSTTYEYAMSNNQKGSFVTGPPTGLMAPGKTKFTFLTSSCIKPRFPYNPFDHPLTIPGLKHLAKWIPDLQASFMLFLGDFIYIDVPHRFGTDVETYRREYRQVYSSPDWPGATANLPWIHVIDDHEIANDWDKQTSDPYPAAIDPWDIYHGSINPPPALPNTSYYHFTHGPASFLMLDTRRYRSPEFPLPPNSPHKSMLGPTQLSSLLAFLSRPEPPGVHWKFIISSIPFTRNWRLNAADTWAGYLHERRIILEAMWDVSSQGDGISVVILSGDRHEFAATSFSPPKEGKWPPSATVHEFSTSPLSMFYLPLRSYWTVPEEDDFEERCIKYAPDGNSKFGAVELENVSGGERGRLKFRLFVDGRERWEYVLLTPLSIENRSEAEDAV